MVLSTQDYVGGIEYKNEVLEAIYHAEGRVYFEDGTNRYEYTITDHLGNARLTFTDKDGDGRIDQSDDPVANEVLQENHYYPFGMAMEGQWIGDPGRESKYRYNGKELEDDFGLNWYAYGARYYDPAIGRWSAVDPLAADFAGWSPFSYTVNNPIRFIDPDGRAPAQPDDWVKTSSGAIVYDSKVTDKASAQERYGASAQYIGESAVFQDGSGNQVSLNGNGRITQASFFNTVEVSASRTESGLGVASDVASKLDLATGANTALVQGAIALSGGNTAQYADGLTTLGKGTKLLGRATGITSIADSVSDVYNNPTAGNTLKLAFDVGVTIAKINPVTGIVIGALEVTGAKDNAAITIDRAVENIQYSNWLNAQTIKIK